MARAAGKRQIEIDEGAWKMVKEASELTGQSMVGLMRPGIARMAAEILAQAKRQVAEIERLQRAVLTVSQPSPIGTRQPAISNRKGARLPRGQR